MRASAERPTQLRLSVPARPPLRAPSSSSSSSSSSSLRHYPSFPYTPSSKPFPFSPAATPTPSKRPGAKVWLPWLCTLLHLASLYWLNTTTSLHPVTFTFLALLLSAVLTAMQQQPPPWNRPLTGLQRGTLVVDGAAVALLFFLRFVGCRACGPMEAILAEFAGALAGKALLGKSGDRGKRIRGLVALVTGSFLLSRGWDRAGCFPAGNYASAAAFSCDRLFRLAVPLAAGVMASLEKSCANRSSIRHLGKRRIRLISLSIAAAILFPFAVTSFFLWDWNPGPVYISSGALVGSVALGVVASFYGETYSEEKLLVPPLSPKPFFMTVCCLCGLELVFGLELSLLGFLLCSFILWIAVRDLGSPSSWMAYSILESDPSDAFLSLVKNPLHHILSERKSRKIAIFLLINAAFMVVEFVSGFMSNSLGLISDACHMLFDCAALAIGLYASYISRLPANGKFNYGYGRFEVLSGYVNAVFLVLVGSLIVLESLERILDPQEISTESLLLVSVGGLLVNIVGLVFFHEEHHHAHVGGSCSHSNGTHSHTHSHETHDHDHHSHGHSHTCTIKTVPCSVEDKHFVSCEKSGSNSSNNFREDHDVHKVGHANMQEDHPKSHIHTGHNHGEGESHHQSLQGDNCKGHGHINQAEQITCEQHQLVVSSHKHEGHSHLSEHDHQIQSDHDHLNRKEGLMLDKQAKDVCVAHHDEQHHNCKHDHDHGHAHSDSPSHLGHSHPHLEDSHSHNHSHLEDSHSHGNSHLEHSCSHSNSHLEHRHSHSNSHLEHNHSHLKPSQSHSDSHLEHSHLAENHSSKEHRHIDHNMEGIFLHVLADTLGSVGVVASTLVIKYKEST
ncbi:hypothetical protein SUGI_0735990 [Cryptomeria japonica]|nr:hypothetical protein SUGI_0735990 [Cryptomeria japonica]